MLTSEAIWDNMLHGAKGAEFNTQLEEYTKDFVQKEAGAGLEPLTCSPSIISSEPSQLMKTLS